MRSDFTCSVVFLSICRVIFDLLIGLYSTANSDTTFCITFNAHTIYIYIECVCTLKKEVWNVCMYVWSSHIAEYGSTG